MKRAGLRLFTAVLLVAFSGLALAHAHLESATPAQGQTVKAAPSQLTLHFSEAVNLAFTGADISGPNGQAISTGKATLKASNDKTMIVPVTTKLASGTYTVHWHALSVDGHKTHGSYEFSVARRQKNGGGE